MADPVVDAKYKPMRERYGASQARANGYLVNWFFLREQAFLIPRIKPGKILDVACGSGLMLQPLKDSHEVLGIDFNSEACSQARLNHVEVIRGDAFRLPFKDESFDAVINCQFFNQQPPEQVELVFREATRVVKPGGQVHLLWRGGHTLLHRVTYGLFSLINRLTGQPNFPQFIHRPNEMKNLITACGLSVRKQRMTLPMGPSDTNPDSLIAKCVGASNYLQLEKDA